MQQPPTMDDSSRPHDAPHILNSKLVSKALYDYGKLYKSESSYNTSSPTSIDDLRALVSAAQTDNRRIRVRGSGHTFNGCTLPAREELLVRTHQLNWYRCDESGTITVGAGVLVWDIRDFVRDFGYELPVHNGGWAGPTLGGYICAGGFGKGSLSDQHGGLWENVLSITLVDGTATEHVIERTDPRFAWLFGSYGQLGIIVEAKLKILPTHPAAGLLYPKNRSGLVTCRQSDDPSLNDNAPATDSKVLFWFSLLLDPSQEASAWQHLLNFCLRYTGILQPNGGWAGPLLGGNPIGYRYNIRYKEFNPPLVYNNQGDFIVLGVMSFFNYSSYSSQPTILDIERDFIKLATDNNFRLYLQAENIGRNVNYEEYYGSEVFSQFRSLKECLDPEYLINPGIVFS